MSKIKKIPSRAVVKTGDTWDLSSLYASDEAWEKDLKKLTARIPKYQQYAGKLGSDVTTLLAFLKFDNEFDKLGERLGIYAFLKTSEDQANGNYQGMMERFQNVASQAGQAASFLRPEILSIPKKTMDAFLDNARMAPHRLSLERLIRKKKHTLSKKEEKLLAMQSEMSQAPRKIFNQLLDSDLKFGTISDADGQQLELSNATFSQLLHSPKRAVRKKAFHQYYAQFNGHENTLAATLSGSIQTDIYYAKARGYSSALGAALFGDNMPAAVYENLIASVHRQLPALHRYYDLRRRKMRLRDIHHYDTYVPILSELDVRRNWHDAVKLVMQAFQPLGEEYCGVLGEGLRGRWCDRYPNRGKRSGAFSCGSFTGDPYILMNYKPTVFDDVFTLAHEAGHSMHSYYSARNQPYQYYSYTIFVAEVASTFNEQLLSHHMMQSAKSAADRAYLINRELDGIRATIIRQTMFAEFEKITHEMAESGEPLTLDAFKDVYWTLLQQYFGPEFALDDELRVECLRIPHFYRAFYVYKYATGLSAAIALSKRVLNGGTKELQDYLKFLKGGCSKWPLDLLRDAGVDMERPEPVDTALQHFDKLVDELDGLL